MDSNNTNCRIPKLRFPGFSGEWEVKKLGEVAQFKRGTTITAKETVEGDVPVIAGGKTPSYYHNVANREGQTIAISGSGAYAGFVSFWETPVFLSDSFSVDTNSEIDRKYLYYYLKHRQHALFQMQKGAGVPHVHGSDVGELCIPLPSSLAEQKKIASCLSELDNQISAQGQKVGALKEKKKGLMQQLFPQTGETAPRLRFPGFTGDWEKKKLGEVAFFYKGKGISKSEASNKGETPCIRYGELYTYYKEVISVTKSFTNIPLEELFLSKANDVIIPSSGETKEDISTASCILNDNVALGADINVIRSSNNGVFLSYYLNTIKKNDIAKIAQGISIIHLYNDQLKTLQVDLPSFPEQQKIADCLSALDNTITAESDKLEALKTHKKGLMQQLFPEPIK